MSSKELVSVLIPTYNNEKYIKAAIESIQQQTYPNLQIVVVNDCSTDGTPMILQDIAANDSRVVVITNSKNLNISASLNKGLQYCKGKYIARMDGDDVRDPESIERQVAFLRNHDEVVVVGGTIEVCGSNMEPLYVRNYPLTDADIRSRIFRYNPFAHPAVMIRASAVKGECYSLDCAEDYHMWFILGRKGKLANLDSKILKLRTHPGSISQSKLSYQEYLTLYIRLKAIFEYGYKMTLPDKWYFFLQLVSKHLMPTSLRFKLFNLIRGRTAKGRE